MAIFVPMNKMLRSVVLLSAMVGMVTLYAAKKTEIAPSYAWETIPPLGLHEPSTIDTLLYNYYQTVVPSEVSKAYATTGNLGGEGMNMIYFDRPSMSDFFFRDPLRPWLPSADRHKFYNTRIPMTLLSYSTGGGRENTQERLKTVFSGNANEKLQVGAHLDYIYSKGAYDNQAAKDLIWGGSFSYMGDRWEIQAMYSHWNMLNKENGGITDERYITDPAEMQGGSSSIDAKSIPTNLSRAHTRLVGGQFYMNNRYKVGYYEREMINDTTEKKTYIPVSSFIWTLNYRNDKHLFYNHAPDDAKEFWKNSYLDADLTRDRTCFWSLENTFGISLLEGFNKYAKAGLAAFMTHEIRKYTQTADTVPLSGPDRPMGLSPYPFESRMPSGATENLLWVGGQLTKQRGRLLNYEVTARFGLVGPAAGEIKIDGNATTRFKLLGDTVSLNAYGLFKNETAPYLMNNYVSNHFIWHNDFGKTRTFRAGGKLNVPHTRSLLNVGVENVQNLIYFNSDGMPVQEGGSVQVFSASLQQNFKVGILHWNNSLTYQTSSNENVLPLPKFAVYSNLYLLFKVAKVLDVQFGIDCDYYTSYYAPSYQPATMAFCNQNQVKIGNYPFMNLYANMKLSKARFFVLFSHVNQGMTGDRYFSMPLYPLNPRKLQLGVSIDFNN